MKTSPKQLTYEVQMPDREKRFQELVIYISDKCANADTFSATLLNKILWASDFRAYQNRGRPITGEQYRRLENGPTPVRLVALRAVMIERGDIVIRKKDYHGKQQHRIVPTRCADLSIFSGDEIALVDQVIESLCRLNSTQVSDLSHQRAWKTRHDKDLMPYESVFLSNDPVTDGDISRTEQLKKEYGWHEYPIPHHVVAKEICG